MKKVSRRSAYTRSTLKAGRNSKGPARSSTVLQGTNKPIVSIAMYRSLTKDTDSSDKIVMQRLFCLEKLCRGVIILELRNYE